MVNSLIENVFNLIIGRHIVSRLTDVWMIITYLGK